VPQPKKTNQFWKNPELLDLIRKQRKMFRTMDKPLQPSRRDESPAESEQQQASTELMGACRSSFPDKKPKG
jgi:hypothetical protein